MPNRKPACPFLFSIALLAAMLSGEGRADVASTDSALPAGGAGKPKNVIIMIADGCGVNTIKAADLYLGGEGYLAPYESYPVSLFMSTYSSEGSGYDPARAHSDPEYVRKGATDSAAAATAMATGVKTYDGAIGVDANKTPVKTVLERAEELGKATGVISTVPFSHATPASFVAHNPSRSAYAAIAAEMIEKSPVDVIMGPGHPLYDEDAKEAPNSDTDGDKAPDSHDYKYVGGEELWRQALEGKAGASVDADHNGQLDDPWSVIQTREEFLALKDGPAAKRVLGVPQVYTTLQSGRSGPDDNLKDDAPYAAPLNSTVPTLADMTLGALNALDGDADGFFLMVEGGAVDWANHSNQLGRAIEELSDFNAAVAAVDAWVSARNGWNDTLVVVTADHETGYLTAAGEDPAAPPRAFDRIKPAPKGTLPAMRYGSGSHTNQLVPFYAKGAGSAAYMAEVRGEDPDYGRYIDNTSVARVIFDAWK